ncbi:MAG: WecB/TagA/CpsF family glycosyltransferase [Desulfobacteraceae bacterium]|nr:WecB/TagA/CpsF family glycosyltransferase [Desulfobacteraceae bacterium]
MFEKVDILRLPIAACTMSDLLNGFESLIAAPGCATAYAANAHTLNLTYESAPFYQALRSADILYADGKSLLLAARILGKNLPQKLTTTDVWPHACELASRRGYSFFLLGGEPGLAERAKENALRAHPGLRIVGTHDGYFRGRDREVISLINEKKPDILWVGMGEPLQALWVEKYRRDIEASLVVTCGGMFKIVSGELRRLPSKWREAGFEWLYRMVQEPRTASRYLIGLPVFGTRILAQRFGFHFARPQNT